MAETGLDQGRLTAAAHALMKTWNCRPDGKMFFTHASLLWPVTRAGDKYMLKIAGPDDDEAFAADMLRHYGGRGAVRLVKSEGHAQLLERISDETRTPTLIRHVLSGTADTATHIICDVIEKLHAVAEKAPLKKLIPFDARQEIVRAQSADDALHGVYATALALGAELVAATKATWQPLHGDIHHENILYSSMRGWLAIDPKGLHGPRAYEYATVLCNPYAAAGMISDPKHMARQAAIIAERAGLDKKELLHFAFLHAMQCAAWSAGGDWKDHCRACAATAAALAGLK